MLESGGTGNDTQDDASADALFPLVDNVRFVNIVRRVIVPGVPVLMLNIALYSAIASFSVRANDTSRAINILGAVFLGMFLGAAFFPRLIARARRREGGALGGAAYLGAALWFVAAAACVLAGFRQYAFNEQLRVVANLFLGMMVAPVHQLFYSRFPVAWRGTWFGASTGAGVLCWNILLSLANLRQVPEGAALHSFLPVIYLTHTTALVILSALCVHALAFPARDKSPVPAPLAAAEGNGGGNAVAGTLVMAACIIYLLNGALSVKLMPIVPAVPFQTPTLPHALSILVVVAAPLVGWLFDRRPERIFRRVLPVCCALFILTPSLAAMDATHMLYDIVQPFEMAGLYAFYVACCSALAGLAPDAGAAARYPCYFAGLTLLSVFVNILWVRVLAVGPGTTVFVATILAFLVYRLGPKMGGMATTAFVEKAEMPYDEAALSGESIAEKTVNAPEKYDLTPRESEVAELFAKGKTPAEIAQQLSISEHTVKTHFKHIMGKMEVSSRNALMHKLLQE